MKRQDKYLVYALIIFILLVFADIFNWVPEFSRVYMAILIVALFLLNINERILKLEGKI